MSLGYSDGVMPIADVRAVLAAAALVAVLGEGRRRARRSSATHPTVTTLTPAFARCGIGILRIWK
jgi:hypothetical protein